MEKREETNSVGKYTFDGLVELFLATYLIFSAQNSIRFLLCSIRYVQKSAIIDEPSEIVFILMSEEASFTIF